MAWINNKEGMDLGKWTGEFKEVTEHNGKAKFIKRSGDKVWGIDQLAQAAYDEGLIKDNEPETLLEALKYKNWTPPSILEQKAEEGEGAQNVDLSTLKPGDKVVINGETFTHSGKMTEDGKEIWVDGENIEVDPFEVGNIKVDNVIRSGKEVAEKKPEEIEEGEGALYLDQFKRGDFIKDDKGNVYEVVSVAAHMDRDGLVRLKNIDGKTERHDPAKRGFKLADRRDWA